MEREAGGLKPGDRVVMTAEAAATFSSRRGRAGVCLAGPRGRYGTITIQRDGLKHPDRWAPSFWERAPAEPTEGQPQGSSTGGGA